MRDPALFDLAVNSKLRGFGVLKNKIGELVVRDQIHRRAIVDQQKTGRLAIRREALLLPGASLSLVCNLGIVMGSEVFAPAASS